MNLSYDPAGNTILYGIFPKDSTSSFTDTCSTMFISALFTIAGTWKPLKCPSTDKQIMKMWDIYIVGYSKEKK